MDLLQATINMEARGNPVKEPKTLGANLPTSSGTQL